MRFVQHLMNGVQRKRRRDMPPEAHDHTREVIATGNETPLFLVSGHGDSKKFLFVFLAIWGKIEHQLNGLEKGKPM